jgi:pimeloyl-ACP methyl ester carboxylesterase
MATTDDDDVELFCITHGTETYQDTPVERVFYCSAYLDSADMKTRSPVTPVALLLLCGTAWATAGHAAAPDAPAAAPTFSPCRLAHPMGLAGIEAECTRIEVAESDAPGARRIALSVARIPAINRRKGSDPLFLIAGGPGGGTQDMYATLVPAFARVNRDRDLILLDQRGTGRSGALDCPDYDDDTPVPERIEPVIRACLTTLQRDHDVAQYTTSVAVRDLDAVRRALGYPRINLYGVSYGSRVAQHYLRRYPAHTRSVILDGVVQPDRPLGPDLALDAEASLQKIFARCRGDAACRAAFGDPEDDYRALRTRLANGARRITLPKPRSGEPQTLDFGLVQLGIALRFSSYGAASAAVLPLALHRAVHADDYTPLATLYGLTLRSLEQSIAAGMHNSVVCTEDIPFVQDANVDRATLAATYLGNATYDLLKTVCRIWPRGPLDADLRTPLRSAVPVLLLSGSDDPVTPPAYAIAAMRGLSRSRHVLLAGEGHGQVGVRCMDRVLEDFLRATDPAKLDTTCLAKRVAAPFLTTLAGPAP